MGMRIANTTPAEIALTGMVAQSTRMKAISNNIANANNTGDGTSGPYARMDVQLAATDEELGGVDVVKLFRDRTSEFRRVLEPGHPAADAEGWVQYPNVQIPQEMMRMMLASRAYQANAAVLKRQQDISSTALELLR